MTPTISVIESQHLPPVHNAPGDTRGTPAFSPAGTEGEWLLPLESAIPAPLRFAPVIDPRLKIVKPFFVSLQRSGSTVTAYAENVEEFGYGGDSGEALHDLGRTIAELFFSLEERVQDLGPGLQFLRGVLAEHVVRTR